MVRHVNEEVLPAFVRVPKNDLTERMHC